MAAGAEVVEDSVKVALGYRLQKDSGTTVYAGWAQKDPLALNGTCANAVTWKLRPARTGVVVGKMALHASCALHLALPAGRPIQLARVRMAVINSVFSSTSSGLFGYSIEPLSCVSLLSGSGYSSATLLG